MAWMRKTRIRTFMQLELEACLDEINWMVRCHNCEAINCPQEEYPARPLPIPPDYINNLQSRLTKVKKGIRPSTLKMILKTHYHFPARSAPITSPTVQPDDVMGGHRDGENSPRERPRASEEEKKVTADGASSTDEGGDFISQTEVGMDHKPSQLADHHFELAMFRQHQRTTAKSTDWGETTPFKQTSRGTRSQLQQHESQPVGRLPSAGIGEERHRLTKTSSMMPAGRVPNCSFLPSGHAVLC